MSYYPSFSLYVAGIITVTLLFSCFKRRGRLPPGPKPLPLVGNIFQMPKEREWLVFSKWSENYGDCIYVNVLGQPIVILNSSKAANDLLESRSSLYSSRPRLVMAGDLTGFDNSLQLMPYTERFRQMRQLIKKELAGNALQKYWPLHEEESRTLVRNLIANPAMIQDAVRHYSGSIILKVTYGYQTIKDHDPFLALTERVMTAFSDASQPGVWLVDLIPWLRHIPDWTPGATFKRKAAEWSKLHLQVIEGPYIWAKARQEDPSLITPNFISTVLSNSEELKEDKDNLLLWASASLFGGGADTTVSSISSFFFAAALHPDVQKRGQDEIDRTLGGKRLPKISDRASLPYVESIMREVMRWNPVTPLSLPHLLTADDEYQGYHIPKGSIVIPNVWSMLHDPSLFPDPEKFRPERFLGNQDAIKVLGASFGFGRRACPGVQFAEATMFIAIATALATSDISNATDRDGRAFGKDALYTMGTISHPPYFRCDIKARSSCHQDLLNNDAEY